MACRILARAWLVAAAFFIGISGAAAQSQSKEVDLASTPFALVGPLFNDAQVTAREYEIRAQLGRRVDVFVNGTPFSGMLQYSEAALDRHYTERFPLKRFVEVAQKTAISNGANVSWGKSGRMVAGLGRYDYLYYGIDVRSCVAFRNYFARSGGVGWRSFIIGTMCAS